jgi:hypothetical protein
MQMLIGMVRPYRFLELFIGKIFIKENSNSVHKIFFNAKKLYIYSTQSYDKIQWITSYILQTFNVPETYKNKSSLKRIENSEKKSRMYLITSIYNNNFLI